VVKGVVSIKMNDLVSYEDVLLKFIKSHPDVTIIVERDQVRDQYIIGLHSEANGKFRKYKIVLSDPVDRESFVNMLYLAYKEVAI